MGVLVVVVVVGVVEEVVEVVVWKGPKREEVEDHRV